MWAYQPILFTKVCLFNQFDKFEQQEDSTSLVSSHLKLSYMQSLLLTSYKLLVIQPKPCNGEPK